MIDKLTKLILASIMILLMYSCYYDNKEELYPVTFDDCDTMIYDFTSIIQPILSNNCLGCHSSVAAGTSGGNIDLEGYSSVKLVAQGGNLLGALKHEAGFSAMPKGGGKLDDCSILLIEVWMNNNYPE